LSFFNCQKYPPSLDYLLITLGPTLLALAALDGARLPPGHLLVVFGRVPLFYYVLHLYLIQLAARVFFFAEYGKDGFFFSPFSGRFGVGLPGVYLAWALIVVALYLPCRWYAELKRKSRNPWLSYL
jgi:hypothetical protein